MTLVELATALRADRNVAETLRDRLAIAATFSQDQALRHRAAVLASQIIDLDARAMRITTAVTAIAGEAIAIDNAVVILRAEVEALNAMAAGSPAERVEQAAEVATDLAKHLCDRAAEAEALVAQILDPDGEIDG
jgi:hypothetical protein